jgi:small GTP-binding protein
MGGIVSSISAWITGKKEVRVLILGLDSAGKTTLLYYLSLRPRETKIVPTIAFNIETVEVGKLRLQIWDMGGQRDLRPYWRLYFANSDGIAFVVDANDRERIDLCAEQLKDVLAEDELRGVPVVVMANKQDLESAMKADEISRRLQLTTIKDRQWSVLPTSGLQGTNVREAFAWLSEAMEARAK